MCGIVGAHHPALPLDIQIGSMLSTLQHRGPDDEVALSLAHNSHTYCMLGATRLSIVDPLAGMQPISDPSNRYWVTMNGEIYNHQSLRRECISNGFPPLNGSDTAVVAALCAFLPISKVLERLRGMFALAITDTKTGELYLIRDRMGVKPLYWSTDSNNVLFWSSEVRGLLTQKSIDKTPNLSAFNQLLMFEYVPSPFSMWRNIHKLQPGQYLYRKGTDIQLKSWWKPPVISHPTGSSFIHWQKSLRFALRLATQLRAEADVEVGTLLSGGIDSATVTALAAQTHPNIRSFSLSMPIEGFDEAEAAKETANSLGLRHHTTLLKRDQYDAFWHNIFDHMDEPLADSSLLPTWALMKNIKENGIKCVLSGDGADESFMGYPTYVAHHFHPLLKMFQRPIHSISKRLAANYSGVTRQYMLQRWASVHSDHWALRHQLWMGAWMPNELHHPSHDVWDVVLQWAQKAGDDRVGRSMFLDQRLYLAEGVLTKVDRASMAHGVEVRSPFMDHYIVELAAQLPLSARWKNGQQKHILRTLVPELPKNTTQRPKKGFGAPIALYLKHEGKHWLKDLPERCEAWIRPDHLRQVIKEHIEGKYDHRRRLWSAICLSQWAKRFL